MFNNNVLLNMYDNHRNEQNKFKKTGSDTLTSRSYQLWEWETNITNRDTSGNLYKVFYRERRDMQAYSSVLKDSTLAKNTGFSANINSMIEKNKITPKIDINPVLILFLVTSKSKIVLTPKSFGLEIIDDFQSIDNFRALASSNVLNSLSFVLFKNLSLKLSKATPSFCIIFLIL